MKMLAPKTKKHVKTVRAAIMVVVPLVEVLAGSG